MHTELAHTAEHAFVGSLQKLIGVTLSVRKVEHRDKDSVVFIDANYLDIELIARAQSEVNLLIVNGRESPHIYIFVIEKCKGTIPVD